MKEESAVTMLWSWVSACGESPVALPLAKMIELPVLPILACVGAGLVLWVILRSRHSDGNGMGR
jgi:hypothetical protein